MRNNLSHRRVNLPSFHFRVQLRDDFARDFNVFSLTFYFAAHAAGEAARKSNKQQQHKTISYPAGQLFEISPRDVCVNMYNLHYYAVAIIPYQSIAGPRCAKFQTLSE